MSRIGAAARTVAAMAALAAPLYVGTPAYSSNGAMTWGFNQDGQLGVGTQKVEGEMDASFRPLLVQGLDGVESAAQSYAGAVASLEDGGVMTWGVNSFGSLGVGTNSGPEECPQFERPADPCSMLPIPVPGLPGPVRSVAEGSEYDLALLADGTVMAWGDNQEGELGQGEAGGPERCEEHWAGSPAPCSRVPLPVPGLGHVKQIAAAESQSFALLEDGTVVAWGEDEREQLGVAGTQSCGEYGWTRCVTTPTPVPGLSHVVAIAAGSEHTLALLADGSVMAWGSGRDGVLGNGTQQNSGPAPVPGISGAVQVVGGYDLSAALLGDGTVMEWGNNEYGELGQGESTGPEACPQVGWTTPCSMVPLAVPGMPPVKQITTGWMHTLALLNDGTVWAWGSNNGGTLGIGFVNPELCGKEGESGWSCSRYPVQVTGLDDVNVIAVDAGGENSVAIGPLLPTVKRVEDEEAGDEGSGEPAALALARRAARSRRGLRPAHGRAVSAARAGAHGPEGGGTSVRITGTDLAGATAVHFGESSASFKVKNLAEVVAVVPPGTGTVTVTVTTPRGESNARTGPTFTYTPSELPVVASVSPPIGAPAGGTTVTIEGTSLAQVNAVRFGGRDAQSFVVESPGVITAVSPPGSGKVDVTALAPEGESLPTAGDRYTYGVPTVPAVAKLAPKRGPSRGGYPVTISGKGFIGVTAVTFGGAPAEAYTVASTSSITAVAPPGTSGAQPVEIIAAGGSSPAGRKAAFRYDKPLVLSTNPEEGPATGGGTVTIEGSGFAPGADTSFLFGKFAATDVSCVSTFLCTMTVPPATRPGPVTVLAAAGSSKSNKAGGRVYAYR